MPESDAPKFDINTVIYLRSSAIIAGNIESYKVVMVGKGSNGLWIYRVDIPVKPPAIVATVGDMNTNKRSYNIDFPESELCTLCEAVALAISFHNNKLTKLHNIVTAYCS